MITKISVYSEGATDQVLEPDMAYSHLWTTVRKDGTTEQLVTLFLDKANQIATRLKNNTASNTEENSSAQFLVGIGAVVIDVLPTVPKIKQQENEEVDEEMESEENEAVGEETGSAQEAAESDMAGGSTKHTSGSKRRKSDAKEKDDGISKGMAREGDVKVDSVLEVKSDDGIVLNDDIIDDVHVEPNEDETTQDDTNNESSSDDDYDVEPQDDSSEDDNDEDTPRRRSTRLQLRPQRRRTAKSEGDSGMNKINSKPKRMKTERIIKKTVKKTSTKKEKRVGSFACHLPLCSSKVSSCRELKTHLKVQHGYDTEAAIIAARDWYKQRRRGHTRKVNVNATPFVCMMGCKLGFVSRSSLHTHLCTTHQITEEQSHIEIAKEHGVISSSQLPDSVFYSCPIDVKSDDIGTIQEEHSIELKPKPACPKCGKEFEEISQARSHFTNDCTSNPLQCKICGTKLGSLGGYKVHMETHENEQKGLSFPCKTCGKVFYNKYYLTQHEVRHNPGFICDLCGKAFPNKSLFERHKNVKHTKEKKFTCSECSKVYYSKKDLMFHISLIHGKLSELVACHICGKMMKKGGIKNHLATVHEDSGSKCPICNKEFKHKRWLGGHMKEVHGNGGGTQYPCTWPNCDKVFVRKRSLKSHLDVHNDVTRFTCSLCSKKFRNKTHLKNHMNWHGGIKPYKCPHCEKSFLTKGNLTKHLPTHDSDRN